MNELYVSFQTKNGKKQQIVGKRIAVSGNAFLIMRLDEIIIQVLISSIEWMLIEPLVDRTFSQNLI